jgi:hypothetical protein
MVSVIRIAQRVVEHGAPAAAAAVLFMVVSFCIFTALAGIGDLPRLMGRQRPLRD